MSKINIYNKSTKKERDQNLKPKSARSVHCISRVGKKRPILREEACPRDVGMVRRFPSNLVDKTCSHSPKYLPSRENPSCSFHVDTAPYN